MLPCVVVWPGLAAGFDKDAEAVEGLLRMGFGFVEVGAPPRDFMTSLICIQIYLCMCLSAQTYVFLSVVPGMCRQNRR